jgi:hypothetical protein
VLALAADHHRTHLRVGVDLGEPEHGVPVGHDQATR